jgi:hypothetical protein
MSFSSSFVAGKELASKAQLETQSVLNKVKEAFDPMQGLRGTEMKACPTPCAIICSADWRSWATFLVHIVKPMSPPRTISTNHVRS